MIRSRISRPIENQGKAISRGQGTGLKLRALTPAARIHHRYRARGAAKKKKKFPAAHNGVFRGCERPLSFDFTKYARAVLCAI